MEKNCIICRKPVEESEAVRCVICGSLMHKSCASDEVLLDANEDNLCPYDAIIAALDWLDAIITTYVNILNEEQRIDIISRLKSYIDILEGKEVTS